ncbi:hypothetical protein AOQ84DRAFT_298590 [Glonium stellatum]|uniref:Zn(2)-C6 fungal-type domain-containing protein n=1 Tax=Glonium stellatum TaxID=574774 RepID=A0A8E2JQF4_9PEZI|nr:hypothetical protein AOQ84DRAFT_298590 [Glonium stellatum]
MSNLQPNPTTATLRWANNAPKKACKQCSEAKRRCGLERPICSRCETRKLDCQYRIPGISEPFADSVSAFAPPHQSFAGIGTVGSLERDETSAQIQHNKAREDALDFTAIHLVPITNSTQIGNRWMEAFVPTLNQRPKTLHLFTVQYLSCVFRTYYKSMLLPGGFPPIIHPLQAENKELFIPLANCYALVRKFEEHSNTTEVTLSIQQEMDRLLREYQSYGHIELLAAFQAFLLYTLMMFFSQAPNAKLVDHKTLVHLQEIASHVSATGLLCDAELSCTRPKWEDWIIASAKRRAIYAMYLFSNVFNAISQQPTHIAEELTALPVPCIFFPPFGPHTTF